jgi:ubiquinone biosynthesis O-methyltransferase
MLSQIRSLIDFLVLRPIRWVSYRLFNRGGNDLTMYHRADWWNPQSPWRNLLRMNPVRVPYFKRHFPNRPCLRILDAGCGGGFVSEALAVDGYDVTGIDISEHSLEIARAHSAGRTDLKLHYQQASLYGLPFPDASFDVVVSSDVLEHLTDLPAALREIRRVLKPDGVFLFDTITRSVWTYFAYYLVSQEILGLVEPGAHDWNMFIRPEELEALLTAAGFETNRSVWAGIQANLSLLNAVKNRSKFDLIESFYEDKSFSASYMGCATIRQ